MDEGFLDINKIANEIIKSFDSHYAAAFVNSETLKQMLMDNPNNAINLIVDAYNQGLNQAYTNEKGENARWFIQAIAGGPFEAVPWAVYNAVGAVYPYLDREQKNKALEKILNILDERNYLEVNGGTGAGHTTGIREPLLLSDICIVRRLYWPGLHDEEYLWKNKNFSEFKAETISEDGTFKKEKVKSDFLVAYAILRSDITNWGEDYISVANENFLERSLKGIVGLRFPFKDLGKKEDLNNGTKRLKELLPKSLHNRIETIRQEGDWVDFFKFNPDFLKYHPEYA